MPLLDVSIEVRTIEAVKEPIQNWISSQGTVRAVNYKHLAFEVEGDVTYLADRAGRRLREGDRFIRLIKSAIALISQIN